MQNISYQLPKICCRCGVNGATQVRRRYGSRSSVTGFYIVAMTTQTTSFAYNIAVCDECSASLDESDRTVKIGRVLLSIVVAAISLIFVASSSDLLCGAIVAVPIAIALYFSYIRRPISSQSLGGFTGKYFWFSNREYFKQFAELNRQLVAPQDYDRLSSPNSSSVFVAAPAGFQWTKSNIVLFVVLLLSLLSIGVCLMAPSLLS